MYLMISYDVKSDQRRQKIHNLLKDYGVWVQYSAFECRVDEATYRALRKRLKPLILAEEDDNLRFYTLCATCQEQIEQLGVPPATPKPSAAPLII